MSAELHVEQLPYDALSVNDWEGRLKDDLSPEGRRRAERILDYPTVYVVHHEDGRRYKVYVGETTGIAGRTLQHLTNDVHHREDWRALAENPTSLLSVVGHDYFNKSLTLDVENRLMQWLTASPAVSEMYNRRGNAQGLYYTREHFEDEFRRIWTELGKRNAELFPSEALITQSALFKASPFHQLTQEQLDAKLEVREHVDAALATGQEGQLILVEGAAGSGKTVLLSSLFLDLMRDMPPADDTSAVADVHLVVNHEEQLTVYRQIATKLGLMGKGTPHVLKPTTFLSTPRSAPVDVVLVDEAHLLWTQGKQAYRGDHQLEDLLRHARVVVAVFDPAQVMATSQHWEHDDLVALRKRAVSSLTLQQQMRISATEATIRWIRRFIDHGTIQSIPDDHNYDLQIFDDPGEMHTAIRGKARSTENGLSRMLATFDWPYVNKKTPPVGKTWDVVVHNFTIPWNLQIDYTAAQRRKNRGLAWAEREETIDECGSHFTIQGFDLNYAGVILGESVTYRNGRVEFDPSKTANKAARQRRTLKDGTRASVAETLLRNEINVLLTRGVNGLYIFACDPALREALLEAQENRGTR